MRISDWSSDVCSSDLSGRVVRSGIGRPCAGTCGAAPPPAPRIVAGARARGQRGDRRTEPLGPVGAYGEDGVRPWRSGRHEPHTPDIARLAVLYSSSANLSITYAPTPYRLARPPGDKGPS